VLDEVRQEEAAKKKAAEKTVPAPKKK